MNNPVLDEFGRRLIQEYSEKLRKHITDLADGQRYMGAEWYESAFRELRSLSKDQRTALLLIIDDAVTSASHAFLDILEKDSYRGEDFFGKLELKVLDEHGVRHDVAELSDGLAGELYGEEGWIKRFSQERD